MVAGIIEKKRKITEKYLGLCDLDLENGSEIWKSNTSKTFGSLELSIDTKIMQNGGQTEEKRLDQPTGLATLVALKTGLQLVFHFWKLLELSETVHLFITL